MITLKQFRENADEHYLCSEYQNIWDSCKSPKKLIDMAMSAKGVDWMGVSIAEGWGISPDELERLFKPFLNGKYTSTVEGYDSEIYCNFQGEITSSPQVLLLINCNCDFIAKEKMPTYIYATGKCSITIIGTDRSDVVVIAFGRNDNIIVNNNGCNYKRIQKKQLDRYD